MDQGLQKELIRILRDMRNFMESQNRPLEKLESFAEANAKDNGSPSFETQENKHDKTPKVSSKVQRLLSLRTIETFMWQGEKEVEPVWPVRVYYELRQPVPEYRSVARFSNLSPLLATVVRDPHHLVCGDGWKYCECSHSCPAQMSLIVSFTVNRETFSRAWRVSRPRPRQTGLRASTGTQ